MPSSRTGDKCCHATVGDVGNPNLKVTEQKAYLPYVRMTSPSLIFVIAFLPISAAAKVIRMLMNSFILSMIPALASASGDDGGDLAIIFRSAFDRPDAPATCNNRENKRGKLYHQLHKSTSWRYVTRLRLRPALDQGHVAYQGNAGLITHHATSKWWAPNNIGYK